MGSKQISIATIKVGKNGAKAFKLRPGMTHVLRIKAPKTKVDILEAEDLLFRYKSALMLPSWMPEATSDEDKQEEDDNTVFESNDEPEDEQIKVSGLAVLMGVFRFCNLCAHRNEKKRILITGHTDSVGSDSYNEKLSRKRAWTVVNLLLGGVECRDAFANVIHETHVPEDEQHVLWWISNTFKKALSDSWAKNRWSLVDPGDVDGKIGNKTKTAIQKFKENLKMTDPNLFPLQKRYLDKGVTFSSDLPDVISALKDGPKIGLKSWAVIYEIYQAEIQLALIEDGLNLADVRNQLDWVDKDIKAVGCGETWPIEARGEDNFKSQTNRRVEILFYDPSELSDEIPCKHSKCVEEDCHIFKNIDRYETERNPLNPTLQWRYISLDENGNLLSARNFVFSF